MINKQSINEQFRNDLENFDLHAKSRFIAFLSNFIELNFKNG